jgi:multidrug efflux pump
VAVYLPVGFQGGLTGTLFREFAFTLAGAVIISSIVALTLSPMMSSRLLKEDGEKHGFARRSSHTFEQLKHYYAILLKHCLQTRPAVYTAWIVVGLLCIPLFLMSSHELAPTEDQGVIFGIVEGPANATLDQSSLYAKEANRIFASFEETDFTFQLTYPGYGFSGMVLNPWHKREKTVFDLMPSAQQQLATITGINLLPVTPPALPGGGNFPVEFILVSTAEAEDILKVATVLRDKAATSGMFAFPPIIDTKIDKPQVTLQLDKDKVADLGLTLEQVGNDIGIMLSGNYVNRFTIQGRSYRVIPQIKRSERLNPEQLSTIYIAGQDGKLIQLGALAHINYTTVPESLSTTKCR